MSHRRDPEDLWRRAQQPARQPDPAVSAHRSIVVERRDVGDAPLRQDAVSQAAQHPDHIQHAAHGAERRLAWVKEVGLERLGFKAQCEHGHRLGQ